jgi:hypothetical protein
MLPAGSRRGTQSARGQLPSLFASNRGGRVKEEIIFKGLFGFNLQRKRAQIFDLV